jgi:hypothetical protein
MPHTETRLRRSLAAWIGLASLILLTAFAEGCAETSTASSHVRAGDLYAPGQDRYDDYFAAVHSQQATAAQWAADRKSAHQAIVSALKLDGDATDAAIDQAAHAKRTPPHAVQAAIEQTVHADTERAKGLDAMASKIDELVKSGHELEGHVSEDFGKPGTGQSGPLPGDVKMELRASYEVLAKIRDQAKREAKAAEDFVATLQQPHSGGDAHAAKHAAPAKASTAATSSTAATASTAATPAGPTAPPKPQPKPEPGEVFQP